MDFMTFRREKKEHFLPSLQRSLQTTICLLFAGVTVQADCEVFCSSPGSSFTSTQNSSAHIVAYSLFKHLYFFLFFLPSFLSFLKDIYSDFDKEVGEGEPASHVRINDAIKAGMNCLRTCRGGSFPYPPGQREGAQGMTSDFPLTTQVTQSVTSSLYLWATCGLSEGAAFQSVRGRLLCPPFWRHSKDSGCWSIVFWPLLMAF